MVWYVEHEVQRWSGWVIILPVLLGFSSWNCLLFDVCYCNLLRGRGLWCVTHSSHQDTWCSVVPGVTESDRCVLCVAWLDEGREEEGVFRISNSTLLYQTSTVSVQISTVTLMMVVIMIKMMMIRRCTGGYLGAGQIRTMLSGHNNMSVDHSIMAAFSDHNNILASCHGHIALVLRPVTPVWYELCNE